MKTISETELATRYPAPVIRGARITRLGEQYIGPAASDVVTCRFLGEEQIGWFIGGVPSYERMIELVSRIDQTVGGGRWIAVPATRCLADVAHQIWNEQSWFSPSKNPCTLWESNRVTFCVPERLSELHSEIIEALAGIILLDPNCIVHRGRGFGSGKCRVVHDRPQLIVDFRAKLAIGRWSPPLIIMSIHKAAAVATDTVARIYGLDAMHFIEGSSLRCGETGCLVGEKTGTFPDIWQTRPLANGNDGIHSGASQFSNSR
jgi:hypothetical protein